MAFPPKTVLLPLLPKHAKQKPNLMPFHIAYDGPAPVGVYMPVREAESSVGRPASVKQPANQGNTLMEVDLLGSGSVGDDPVGKKDATVFACTTAAPDAAMPEVEVANASMQTKGKEVSVPSTPSKESSALSFPSSTQQTRYTSTFRGRRIHGLDVALPSGYTGLIINTPPAGSSASKPSQSKYFQSKNRRSRRNLAQPIDVDAETVEDDEGEREVRELKPTGSFDSFVVWNSDIPVDEGKDEYVRSLTEWIDLAAAIHTVEEEP